MGLDDPDRWPECPRPVLWLLILTGIFIVSSMVYVIVNQH